MRKEETKVDAAVGALERGKPVHASTAGIDFSKIVGMNVGMGQSATMGALRLMVDLSFGWSEFRYQNRNYRLALRNARLFLECDNAEIEPGSSYKSELQRGEVRHNSRILTKQGSSLTTDGQASGEAGASLRSILLDWMVSVRTSGKLSAQKNAAKNSQEETTVVTRIELVAPAGQNCWMIGCPGKGDPRHEHGILTGEIISAYIDDVPSPLCILSAVDKSKPATGRIIVTADREHFYLVDDQLIERQIDEVLSHLSDVNAETLKKRAKSERDLKSRVAALAGMRTTLPRSKELGSSSLSLMNWTVVFVPRGDDEVT